MHAKTMACSSQKRLSRVLAIAAGNMDGGFWAVLYVYYMSFMDVRTRSTTGTHAPRLGGDHHVGSTKPRVHMHKLSTLYARWCEN